MKKIFTLLFISFLCTTWSFAQCPTLGTMPSDECTFGTSGTLTIPTVDHNGDPILTMDITVEAWGAGGGSGGGKPQKGGGGGGAYYTNTYTVAAGATFAINVGAGANNMPGGNTTFDMEAGVTVGGGVQGGNSFGAGGTVTGGTGTGTPGGNGGDREGGSDLVQGGGGGGGSGPVNTPGEDGDSSGGGAGGTPGGADGSDGDTVGTSATSIGGGAGGKGRTAANTATVKGGDGQVIVRFNSLVLPVELVRFNANAKDNRILLEWQTASEINNEGFVIERGQKIANKLEWNQLDFVEGSGTTQELQAYSFADQRPVEGTNYYRLKQMDYDGAYEYSSTIAIEYSRKDGSTIGIFPNPVKNQLTLINGEGQATIYNALGQAVKHLIIDANQATIQLTDLFNGQYYLQVIQADGTVVAKQFSKVN